MKSDKPLNQRCWEWLKIHERPASAVDVAVALGEQASGTSSVMGQMYTRGMLLRQSGAGIEPYSGSSFLYTVPAAMKSYRLLKKKKQKEPEPEPEPVIETQPEPKKPKDLLTTLNVREAHELFVELSKMFAT